MDYFDLFIKIAVIGMCAGLVVWALKGLIIERTKPAPKIDPKEVTVTMGVMEDHCKTKREEYEKMQTTNLQHAVELIEQSLKHGENKFNEFGKTIDGLTKTIAAMDKSIALLNKEIKEANSRPG